MGVEKNKLWKKQWWHFQQRGKPFKIETAIDDNIHLYFKKRLLVERLFGKIVNKRIQFSI